MIPLRDTLPSLRFPVVTAAIIALNILAFLYEVSLDEYSLNYFLLQYGVVPSRFAWMDVLTGMFLHGGWMHLIGNMWFLWIYGDNVEDILGPVKYLVFYLLCGAAAALAQVIFSLDSRVPAIGASGAIAGVMGAYLLKFPRAKILTLLPLIIFFTTVEIPAFLILAYWFVVQIFSGVGSLASAGPDAGGTAWWAHVGGFAAGLVLIYVMHPKQPYSHRADLHW
jgi:membrane associated rhomboid family serine protease